MLLGLPAGANSAILKHILGTPYSGRSEERLALVAQHTVELPKYELLEEIGHGGMATVFRARDKRLDREVAVKVIHRHLRENPEVAARFHSEALAVAKVKHPNIVEVYDVSEHEEAEKYLVVELVRGITLRQLLREQGPLPPEIAACMAIEVTRALAIAHREGIVHRDIKPENVLLRLGHSPEMESGADGVRVKLTDFGIAKLLDAQGVTHTGQVLGSPAHMAPEQIEGGDVDARADVFGTGVLLYEMLTGSLPFEGKNPAQVLKRVLEGVFIPAERQAPRAGSGYGVIVNRALSREAADRFASAGEMGAALEAELSVVGIKDVRVEIAEYLSDPKRYLDHHNQILPDVLARVAQEARQGRNMALAAAMFNRALAYRPNDTRLLAEVAGLARRERLRRRAFSGLVVGAVGVLLLSMGALAVHALRSGLGSEEPSSKVQTRPADVERPPARTEGSSPAQEAGRARPPRPAEPPAEPAKDVVDTVTRPRAPALARPEPVPVPGTRVVRTPVVGPQNARVRIDGELRTWYEPHTLELGPHTFEFVPPNSECCETSPPQTVEVLAGEGDQVVRGVIRFRPASLRLQGQDGSRASCGIGDVIVAGSEREIPMNRPSRVLSCTVFPPPNLAGDPKQVDIVLSPGRTSILSGQ